MFADIFSWGLLVLSILMWVPVTVLFAQVVAASLPQSGVMRLDAAGRPDGLQGLHRPRIAVLVPAHNEASGIQATIDSLRPQLIDGDRLLVVADNCSDATAAIARDACAEVIERTDPSCLGKSYALDYGVRYLADTPSRRQGRCESAPDVLIIVDADCEACTGSILRLASACATSGRPVQALYLMSAPQDARSPGRAYSAIAEFAWILKNRVRPLGLLRLGLPCQLMGSGMALPWPALQLVSLASGNLVEDAQLGLDFARLGLPPLFCPQALIRSQFPDGPEGRQSQRLRWEHGSLSMLIFGIPRLLADIIGSDSFHSPLNDPHIGTLRGSLIGGPTLRPTLNTKDGPTVGATPETPPKATFPVGLLALTLDLCVPPVALLTVVIVALFVLAVAQVYWLAGSERPLFAAGFALMLLGLAVSLAWLRFGREAVSLGRLLLSPAYALAKLPLYASFLWRRQLAWISTKRDAE